MSDDSPNTLSELENLLRAYLLASSRSFGGMGHQIDSIAHVILHKLPIQIEGACGETWKRLELLLRRRNIKYDVLSDQAPKRGLASNLFPKEARPKTRIIRIPHGQDRIYDFERWVPFVIEKSAGELRSRDASFPTVVVESLYLIYLRHLVVSDLSDSDIEGMVFDDLIDSPKIGRIDGLTTGALSPVWRLSDLKYPKCSEGMRSVLGRMPPPALMYVGCDPGDGSCQDVDDADDRASFMLGGYWAASRPPARLGQLYPAESVKRNFRRSITQIETVERNLALLCSTLGSLSVFCSPSPPFATGERPREKVPDDVAECLVLRMKGLPEQDIAKQLGFDDLSAYES